MSQISLSDYNRNLDDYKFRTINRRVRSLTVIRSKSISSIEEHDFFDGSQETNQEEMIFDDHQTLAAYEAVPLIEIDHLPRGGISFDTKSVGKIQFGIPPETIKDSMQLGMEVPSVYIVPKERFCREVGPALGINMAEFEFPVYFNYFVRQKPCTLVVDSKEDENSICRVFSETLQGPAQFRDHANPKANENEDFDSSYPLNRRPNFYKEFYHFRTAEELNNFEELTIDCLLNFFTFSRETAHKTKSEIGVPPPLVLNDSNLQDIAEKMVNSDDCFAEFSDEKEENLPSFTRSNSDTVLNYNLFVGKHHKEFTKRKHKISAISEKNILRKATSLPVVMKKSPSDPVEISECSCEQNDVSVDELDYSQSKVCDDSQHILGLFSFDEGTDPKSWTYSQAKWLGALATVYPVTVTDQDKKSSMTPRVEIFKMPGALEYIVHDIDKNNHIIGKARFCGSVSVSDSLVLNGFIDTENVDESSELENGKKVYRNIAPPSFHPPSFGVTVLGNSHGFDKSGSTSGYVLWINGRGVMIDPPPYSSGTLEREGIRPHMIFAIIVTHCHADHDAGTFQKVMTGSKLTVITTPTIYKSFIRKYAALSGLNPILLRHSHRYRPAIIGRPCHFQGAYFDFHYTLHTIPCIAFRVEWRGKSIVFSGDHLYNPPMIERLQKEGVLTKERANDVSLLPMRKCDVILHEAGTPPIHTPLDALLGLPDYVRERLYVVHTSRLPEGCPLRVAECGTAGTIRLDNDHIPDSQSIARPLVSYRPTCVSDAWFILNLLFNIPFFSSLSYAGTMEVLETSEVKIFGERDVVVPAEWLSKVLCVVWEGTLMEESVYLDDESSDCTIFDQTVWHAGDWSGPIHLQPDSAYSGSGTDIVAVSSQGAKVIMVSVDMLHPVLMAGSALYRNYWITHDSEQDVNERYSKETIFHLYDEVDFDSPGILNVINFNSVFRSLSAAQKCHLESIAEGPKTYQPGAFLWCAGKSVSLSFLIVSGRARFSAKNQKPHMRRGSTGSLDNLDNYINKYNEKSINQNQDKLLRKSFSQNSEYAKLESFLKIRANEMESGSFAFNDKFNNYEQVRNTRDRCANKVLTRLYSRKAITSGLVFSRGHFLCDTSRLVSQSLNVKQMSHTSNESIYLNEESNAHSSSMVADCSGCVAYIFKRSSLISFFDSNPGILLCLLGTQVVV